MKTNVQIVKEVIDQGSLFWLTPQEIQAEILVRHNLMISDAAITARMRDLRKEKYGKHEVACRPRDGRRSYEYQLVSTNQQQEA